MEITNSVILINQREEEDKEEEGDRLNLQLYKAAASLSKNSDDGGVSAFNNVLDQVIMQMRQENSEATHDQILDQVMLKLSPKRNTLLHVAAKHGNDSIIESLVKTCPLILTKTNLDGDSALHFAARAGHLSTFDKLLRLCRSSQNHSSSSPCVEMPAGEICLLLSRNKKGNQALYEALINRRLQIVCSLIDDMRCCFPLLVMNGELGKSPLYLAVEADAAQIAKLMIDKAKASQQAGGFYLDYDNDGVKSPIYAAISRKNIGILKDMMEFKPGSTRVRDKEGRTPLHWAASLGFVPEIIYLLNKCRSAAFIQDKHGLYPLHLASARGHLKAVQYLLLYSQHPEELVNCKGQNFVHVAASCGKKNVVGYAILTNALKDLVNMKDNDGNRLGNTDFSCECSVFTFLGNYKNSVTLRDGENLIENKEIQLFIVSDMIAMCSVITIVSLLAWVQLGPLYVGLRVLNVVFQLLAVAFFSMCLAFMLGIHLIVHQVKLLEIIVFVTCSIFLPPMGFVILDLLVPAFSQVKLAMVY